MKYWVSDFFKIPKSQANGLIILLPICLIIIALPYLYYHFNFEPRESILDTIAMDSLLITMEQKIRFSEKTESTTKNNKPFKSRFKKDEYIKSVRPENNKPETTIPAKKTYIERKIVELNAFDVNTTDTIELKRIKGIGSVLSRRILKYRDILGGFVNKSQYREVYGLNDTVIWALDTLATINTDFEPRFIAINQWDEWQLARHPYLNKKQSRALVTYRHQHGNFKSIQDLQKVKLLDSLLIRKISPYLEY